MWNHLNNGQLIYDGLSLVWEFLLCWQEQVYYMPLLRKPQQLLQSDAQDLWHHLSLGLPAKDARVSQWDMQSHRSSGCRFQILEDMYWDMHHPSRSHIQLNMWLPANCLLQKEFHGARTATKPSQVFFGSLSVFTNQRNTNHRNHQSPNTGAGKRRRPAWDPSSLLAQVCIT